MKSELDDLVEVTIEGKKKKVPKSTFVPQIDPGFTGHNYTHLNYEYCANPVCLITPDNYDCPYACDLGQEERIDVSSRYFMNLRRGFIARPGFVIVSIDYSQIELRIAANMSGETNWINDFLSGEDLHYNTAKACFGEAEVSDKARKIAKAVNFGSLYGSGAKTLARAAGISLEEAQKVLNDWRNYVPRLMVWMQQVRRESKKQGYAKSYFGRRRYLDMYYNSGDKEQIACADRYAVNHVVQGCLRYDSRILSDEGPMRIGYLYEHPELKPKHVWDGEDWREFKVVNRGPAKVMTIHLDNGMKVQCDDRHIFIVKRGEAFEEFHVKDLVIGSVLTVINEIEAGSYQSATVKAIQTYGYSENTFTLAVDHPNHRFFADGVLHKNTAADLLKVSMLNSDKLIRDNGWDNDARMLLTVHDEIDYEVRESMMDVIIPALREKMEIKIKSWPVPFSVDVEVAKDWGSVEGYKGAKSRFDAKVIDITKSDVPHFIIPRKLDAEQVQILEAIIAEHKGSVPIEVGYDSYVFDLKVDDPVLFNEILKREGLFL